MHTFHYRHINEFQLADVGLAIRARLLSLHPSLTYMAESESTATAVSAIAAIDESQSDSQLAAAVAAMPDGHSYADVESYSKLWATLNAKTFKIHTTSSAILSSTTTTAMNMTAATKGNRANHRRTQRRGQDKVIPTKIKNCPEFIHFGRCSIFNNYQYCPYIHPANFHKVVEYPSKRCPTCTLKLPCFHCPYSFLQKELRELCDKIDAKRLLLEKLIDMAQMEITLLTTDTNTIPFSSPTNKTSTHAVTLMSTDDINLNTSATSKQQSAGTNQRPVTSTPATTSAAATSTTAPLTAAGKTKRQVIKCICHIS